MGISNYTMLFKYGKRMHDFLGSYHNFYFNFLYLVGVFNKTIHALVGSHEMVIANAVLCESP